tara:strand:- start:1801 stop:2637 length:837 start_codon:yes stop_codon:yes gene_type:complete
MPAFVSNAGTRRGKRSCYGLVAQNVDSKPKSAFASRINTSIITADSVQPGQQSAIIGSPNATGLTIQGSNRISRLGATNPDDRTIPLGTSGEASNGFREDNLYRPDFPIKLNARGLLSFPDPIKIPTIEGNLHVSGTITAGTITAPTIITNFTPILTDALGNFVTQTTSVGVISSVHGDTAYMKVSIIWSANALAATEVLTITGFPPLKEGIYLIHAMAGAAVNNVGGHFVAVVDNDGDTLVSLHEVDNSTFAAQSPMTGNQTTTAGQFVINGIVRLN